MSDLEPSTQRLRAAIRVPLWWNQVRMGGRDPSELPAPIGVPEAATALGLGETADAEAVAALDALEAAHAISVPAELRVLATRAGFAQAFRDAHCNNPEWQPPGQWEVVRDLRTAGLAGEVGLAVALPHQGEHTWMVVFDSGDPTGTVYTRHPTDQGPLCLPTAPSLAHWLWDLAETGRDWARGIAAPK